MDQAQITTAPIVPPATEAAAAYKRSHHYPELDALRGLAAFVVVLDHYIRLWDNSSLSPTANLLLNHVLIIFFNGRCSVVLFFLLSGFVLTLPYKRGNELPYGTFVLRRLARIYLPYFAALMVAILADWKLHNPIQVSAWFSRTWTAPLTWPLVLQHVLLIGNYDTAQINTAFWSLAVEMRLSLLFPLLCIPLLRWGRRSSLILLGVFTVINIETPRLLAPRVGGITNGNIYDMTVGIVAFAAGIVLARWLEPAQSLWGRASRIQRVLFFIVSLFLLGYLDAMSQRHISTIENALSIIGGCGIMIVALSSHRASRVLNHRLPAWLGRISYSLYLVHATVLSTIMHLFFPQLSRLQILVPYIGCALAFAALFYLVVEKPSIRLSRSIGRSGRTLSNRPPVTA